MPVLSFKKLVSVAVLASATLLCGLGSQIAAAAAPLAQTPAPGFFRLMVGEFEVTAINDGTIELPVDQLLNHPEHKTHAALEKAFLNVPVETSINAYVINTGDRLILIDAGAGALLGRPWVNSSQICRHPVTNLSKSMIFTSPTCIRITLAVW